MTNFRFSIYRKQSCYHAVLIQFIKKLILRMYVNSGEHEFAWPSCCCYWLQESEMLLRLLASSDMEFIQSFVKFRKLVGMLFWT